MPDLVPVRSRLRWADHHVARVRELVTEYVDRPPFVVTISRDPEQRRVIYRAEQAVEPPAEISLTASDALHQLRATLDNAVGACRVDGPTERSAFVISRSRDDFESELRNRLEGLPGWATDYFRELQPFPGARHGWIGAELQVLHDLARRDRHRALLLQAALVEVHDPGIGEGAMYRQTGVSVAEAEYPDDAAVKPQFSARLVIAEPEVASGREVVELVESLAARVRGVVGNLDQIAHTHTEDP